MIRNWTPIDYERMSAKVQKLKHLPLSDSVDGVAYVAFTVLFFVTCPEVGILHTPVVGSGLSLVDSFLPPESSQT
jgi:hypothetical protein